MVSLEELKKQLADLELSNSDDKEALKVLIQSQIDEREAAEPSEPVPVEPQPEPMPAEEIPAEQVPAEEPPAVEAPIEAPAEPLPAEPAPEVPAEPIPEQPAEPQPEQPVEVQPEVPVEEAPAPIESEPEVAPKAQWPADSDILAAVQAGAEQEAEMDVKVMEVYSAKKRGL